MVSAPRYRLHLLGGCTVCQGAQSIRLGTAREYGLLSYLAFAPDRLFTRDHLIALLWDSGQDRARRHGLSQLLYALRKRLPSLPIHVERLGVGLGRGVVLLDAVELLAAADAGNWVEVCEMYCGRFADGLSIRNARGFDDWRDSVALAVESAAAKAMRVRLEAANSVGNWWLAERTAARLIALNPYDEFAHAARLQAIASGGELSRALTELERTSEVFRRDLGVVPGVEFKDLASRLTSIDRHGLSETTDQATDVRFIGRATEFDQLRQAWRATACGLGAAIEIRGEAGIGKSRLARHLLRFAAIDGGRVLRGRCYEGVGRLPYNGLSDTLASDVKPADCAALGPAWRSALRRLLPELDVPAPVGDMTPAGETGRRVLFEAVAQLLERISSVVPVALYLDDFQWADPSTVAVINYLARRLRAARVLILVATRSEWPVRRSAKALTCEVFNVIHLNSLTSVEAADLLSACEAHAGVEIGALAKASLLARAGGHPLYIVELVRHAMHRNQRREPDRPVGPRPAGVPIGIERLLAARLDALTQTQRRLVNVVAVLGGKCTLGLLVRLSGLSVGVVSRAMETLIGRQILINDGTVVTFVHDLIREVAWGKVPEEGRQALHIVAANALEAMPKAEVGNIALHMYAGGRPSEAYHYAMEAAATASALFAHSESEFFLRLAIATAEADQQRLVAMDGLCQHLYSLGRYAEVAEVMGDLEPWYARSGNRAGLLMAAVVELQGDLAKGVSTAASLGRRARNLAELLAREVDPEKAAGALGAIIEAGHDVGQGAFITTLLGSVYERAAESKMSPAHSQLLATCARAFAAYVDAGKGCECAARALQVARDVGDPASEVIALIAYGTASTLAGSLITASECFERALQLTDSPGLSHYKQRIWNNYGVLLIERGCLSEARSVLEAALGLSTVHDRLFVYANLGIIAIEERQWPTVTACAGSLAEANGVLQVTWGDMTRRTLEAYAALGVGDMVRCREMAREIEELRCSGGSEMIETSYLEILLARAGTFGCDARRVADRLGRAAARSRSTNAGGAARLDLERASVMSAVDPEGARGIALGVARWARNAGAEGAAQQAECLLESLRTRMQAGVECKG